MYALPMSVEHLDQETSRCADVGRPGPMELPGPVGVEPGRRDALVQLVDALPTFLHETDVEGVRMGGGETK
jgi:hypothetical protein